MSGGAQPGAGRRVLVTGATGFIGSQVARAMLDAGHAVRVAVRGGSSLERIEDVRARLDVVETDLFPADPARLAALCEGIELCVHCAWYAVPGKYLAATENLDCQAGTQALVAALADGGCRRAVLTGTCFEYDFSFGYLSEETPVLPGSLYAAVKSATRLVTEQMAKTREMEWCWVRPFYQYGPFEDARRLVPYVIETLIKGEPVKVTRGFQVRDFLHVADVGAAIAAAAQSDLTGIVNIGSGRPITVRDIVSTLSSIADKTDLVEFGARPDNPTDPPFICANTRKLAEGTGWTPRYDLRSGLEHTFQWWSERRARAASGDRA